MAPKTETVGGWDQMVSQIVAAPPTIHLSILRLPMNTPRRQVWRKSYSLRLIASKIKGFEAVYPWFDDIARRGEEIWRPLRWRIAVDAHREEHRPQAR